jgi:hypothetical protein
MPTSLAQVLTAGGELLMQPLPYAGGSAVTRAVWHRRNDHGAGHAWLRDTVAAVAKSGHENRREGPAMTRRIADR